MKENGSGEGKRKEEEEENWVAKQAIVTVTSYHFPSIEEFSARASGRFSGRK